MDRVHDEDIIAPDADGKVQLRKARRRRQRVLVKEMLYDYATNTTLHGLGYTTKRGLTHIEKIFWLITFVASICMCGYLINNVWVKWRTSPVIVTVNEKLIPVRMVPFPSVTICPASKCKATEYNYTDMYVQFANNDSLEGNMTIKYEDVSIVCGRYSQGLNILQSGRNSSNTSVVKNIIDVAPKKSDVLHLCLIRGEADWECESTVSETLTSEGLCFSVNSLAADEILRSDSIRPDFPFLNATKNNQSWSMETGYTDSANTSNTTYPLPGQENGATPDIEIILMNTIKDRDAICNVINSGYKIYIHHPADLPQAGQYYYAALNNQVSSIALSFNMVDTSETLKKYDAEVRQCYFPNEKYLEYFKTYTVDNCRLECLANMTYKSCECVPFYMPHKKTSPICTIQSMECADRARRKLVAQEANKSTRLCRCLPACNSVYYEAEILKTDFNYKALMNNYIKAYSLPVEDIFEGIEFSKLDVFFKRSEFVSMHRSELFGETDFLANIGGLLGLFLGFSFLSLVELVYFLTLRLWYALRRDLKEEKRTLERQNTIKKKY